MLRRFCFMAATVLVFTPLSAYANEDCGFVDNGDYVCGEVVSNAPKEKKEPAGHMFFSNPSHPALQPPEEYEEEALTAPFQPPVQTPMEPFGYTMEEYQARLEKIYEEIEDLSPALQEIAVEKIMQEMSLEEIVKYEGPIVSRKGGVRTFLGKPLR